MTVQQPPILSQSEPFVDRYRRVSDKWFPWLKKLFDTLRRVDKDLTDITVSVGQVSATVGGMQVDIATLQDTSVEHGLTISQVQTLTNTLNSEMGTLSARWGVAINSGGQVIGLVQLDGSPTESTFTVVADKLLVAHPTSAGTTVQAFVVGLVDGVSTVGINGNLVVDGTILARHLEVASLSSITANIGTVTAGKLQSVDGAMVIDLDAKSIVITA